MRRLFSRVFLASISVAASTMLLAAAVSCSAFKEEAPVRFVHNTEDAGSCSKVGDVAAAPQLPDSEVIGSIAKEARKQNADTVVLAKGERKGTSYRCETPTVAKKN
jgi:hypothetical protein